jgi:hypothetical protein
MTHHDNIKHRQPPVWNCHSDDTQSENKHGEICHSEHQHSENRNSEDEHSDNCQNEDKHSINIGILIHSTTKYIKVPDLENLSLMSIALPSISVTMETEYHYSVYIAIEKDDYLESVQNEIIKRFCFVKIIIVTGVTFTDAVNEIADVAYTDNMTSFVRINDDTRFISPNWASTGITTLFGFIPANVGVVGPTLIYANKKKKDRNHVLIHDMVHRTHLDIFGFYCSPVFENCWADDWISEIYKPNRSTKITDWTVRHDRIHGTRYTVSMELYQYFHSIKEQDKLLIENYLR